ncbi:DUF4249 domain-containing protein [Flagellimonas beolgyonensis]|uniref:DUF4249 domain-containing protein n=1 Tax=Flagellimonas beolgyonensis TaxID=864064 RepID=UPI000F8F2DB2|nr:DUF4249 domain-containing protein [Allomuricauda beolgyonensis]
MKVRKYLYRFILFLVIATSLVACIEELDIETLADVEEQGMLVVEAVLTDKVQTQTVYLSRSDIRLDLQTDTLYNPIIPLGSRPFDTVNVEKGATIRVVGSNGDQFPFFEGRDGEYLSNTQFGLQFGVDYALEITTSNGTEYISDPLLVTGTSEITGIYAEKSVNDDGVEGVAIYADSAPLQGNASFYRYAYDETYKIVAPYWAEKDFVLTNYDPCALPQPTYDLQILDRTKENQVCYNTISSNAIDQFSTAGNPATGISRKLVRFITRDNFILAHRYSILLKQYVQAPEAFSFYEVLNKISGSEDIFSQVQPGSIYANMHRKDGIGENVLGYVEAVGVSEQRLFFNFEDFFPGEEDTRPYAFNCYLTSSPESHKSYCDNSLGSNSCPQSVIEQVDLGLINYYDDYSEDYGLQAGCPGPYIFTPRICGDCTTLGDNVRPDFWVD